MYKILTLNKISEVGLSELPRFEYALYNEVADPDGILLRSFKMHDMELPASLKAVARAGAGVNNIPLDKCAEAGVVVFNTPGANANAVKELVLTGLLLSSRKVVEGIKWVETLQGTEGVSAVVEKGKGNFVGPEIKGKKLGVIGLGAIGVLVCNAAEALGMSVMGYDPFLSVDAAWNLSSHINKATDIDTILKECDYITVHVPLNDSTRNMFNKDAFKKAKKGLRLLNFSRGELVNTQDLKEAIDEGVVSKYITDFASDDVIGMENVIVMPHLGASTPEAEDNCAIMAANELKDYLETGNIKNSVNYPNCELPYSGKPRLCILHHNKPNMVGQITKAVADKNGNIDNMLNKSKGDFAYTIIDLDSVCEYDEIEKIDGVIKVRMITKQEA